jgi:hypothetical protein
MHFRVFLLAAAIVFSLVSPIAAAPTPEPGGANGINAVQGNFRQFLFNGQLRLKALDLTAPAAGSIAFPSGQHYVVLHAIVKNGMNKSFTYYPQFDASIADGDGITFKGANTFGVRDDIDLQPRITTVNSYLPGAAWKVQIPFLVPNDFVPAKIVLMIPGEKKAFRINVRPGDVKTQ